MLWLVRTILKTPSHATRNNILVYVGDLLQNALDLGWHTARGSYKVLMTEIEAQTLDWDDLEGVQGIRRQYAQRNVNRPQGTGNKFASNFVKKIVRPAFQNGTCPHEGDHKSENQFFRHICAFCFNTVSKPFLHR